jgi:dolichyl-phosphate beta-glucosyltransferase
LLLRIPSPSQAVGTPSMNADTTIVVPCYNEARRLPVDAFRAFAAAEPRVRYLFVDDGSTDETPLVLSRLVATAPDRFQTIVQRANRGKADAVRVGMLSAFANGGRYAGYWDADLATPLSEIRRFIDVLEAHPDRDICFGARVQLLGREIHRTPFRHYIGRVFATAASVALRLPIYDTQCGAKLFRVSPAMRALFAEPFLGRWTFDVEIIARLTQQCAAEQRRPSDLMYELPLDEWRDIDGSKVHPLDFFAALVELGRIRRRYGSSPLLTRQSGITVEHEHRVEIH